MLDIITSKLGSILNKFSSKSRFNDDDIKSILRDFRKTLLDSDVAWVVTKHLIEKLRIKLNDLVINKKISTKDYFTKIVIDEFLEILTHSSVSNYEYLFNNFGLTSILFSGLNGVGKTTSLIKLANFIKHDRKKKVLVASIDIYRSAAIDQLSFLASKINVDFFSDFSLTDNPLDISSKALSYARLNNYDFFLLDSAGRSQIDNFMMNELISVFNLIKPDFSFLVIDSIVGQDGINTSLDFCKKIDISGFFLTKMDSDSKGGILLSVSFLTKKPIYFIGNGEKYTDISYFYPDRIVSRILGLGDVNTLLEEFNKKIDVNSLSSDDISFESFNLNDFKKQIRSLIDLGGISNFLDKIPGGYSIDKSVINKFDDKFFLKMIYIVDSMTVSEKKFPNLINGSRKRRIAMGSGVSIHDVSKMLKYYDKMKKMFSKIGNKDNLVDFMKKKFF